MQLESKGLGERVLAGLLIMDREVPPLATSIVGRRWCSWCCSPRGFVRASGGEKGSVCKHKGEDGDEGGGDNWHGRHECLIYYSYVICMYYTLLLEVLFNVVN